MAFEQQLEADRIDDFNLFSAFVRVPLLILEGVLGQQKEEPKKKERLDDACERSTTEATKLPQNETVRVVSNEDLSLSTLSISPNSNRKPLVRLEGGGKSNALSRKSSLTSFTDLVTPKKTRQTSWSDESGLSLVEYLDESTKHEPISPYHNATSTKAPPVPIKSAMKRSGSIRTHSLEQKETKRYIPNMKQATNGIVIPTRPYGKDHAATPPTNGDQFTGEFSPQWGWYTSLTPPDVMYAKNHPHHHKRSATEPIPRMTIPEKPAIIEDDENIHHANQVFQCLQNSQKPVAWTSVPI